MQFISPKGRHQFAYKKWHPNTHHRQHGSGMSGALQYARFQIVLMAALRATGHAAFLNHVAARSPRGAEALRDQHSRSQKAAGASALAALATRHDG